MRLPTDFATAQAAGTGSNNLPAGGYVCKIINAKCEDVNGSEKLVLALDIAEGEHKGYYQKKYDQKKQENASAPWPCKYGQFVTTKDGLTNRFFKGMINSIEQSNSGYSLAANNGSEKTLIGKLVGVIFGEEDFTGSNGNVYTAVKPQFFRSIETIRSGEYEIPAKKPIANTPSSASLLSSLAASGKLEIVEDFSDELPF